MGLARFPGHTVQRQHIAILIDTVINKMGTDLLLVRVDARTMSVLEIED
jgi:hypothetical protein